MEYFNIPENPSFISEIRQFKTTDPGHADVFNNVVQALVNNDVFIKKLAEQLFATAVAKSESYSNEVYQQAAGYADQRIAELINGAPETLDTLGEIADAMKENEDVVAALDAAIGSKASEAEFDSHKKAIEKLLGNTDITDVGDGTITGALSELNTGMGEPEVLEIADATHFTYTAVKRCDIYITVHVAAGNSQGAFLVNNTTVAMVGYAWTATNPAPHMIPFHFSLEKGDSFQFEGKQNVSVQRTVVRQMGNMLH